MFGFGEKVEACPYTIRKEKEPVALTEDVQGAQVNNVGAGHVDNMHNACEETDTDGVYGPWMIVNWKRQGQKGTRSVHNTGGTSRTTEFSSRNIDLKFSDRGNTSFGGPNNVLPRRESYFKDKTISNDEKIKWASKIPNPSPPHPAKLQESMRSSPFEVQQEHDTKKGPSTRKHLTYPSSVKGKKAFARGTSTGTPHSYAVTH